MTASTSIGETAGAGVSELGFLPGFGSLVRKELMEWRRGRRAWVVLGVSVVFMALTSVNSRLQAEFAPTDGTVVDPNLDPFVNLVTAVGTQIFIVVAIFACMSLLVAERESGTLAWTASKPVSRSAIWLAKWSVATAVLWLLAGLIPLAITAAVVVALYGPLEIVQVLYLALGIGMATLLFTAVVLAASTVVTSQAAVAAIGIAVIFLPQIVTAVFPIEEFLPTSILGWAVVMAAGDPVGIVTVISWAIAVVALVAFALLRMERLEL